MRTIFDFLRRLLEAKHREAVALEDLSRSIAFLGRTVEHGVDQLEVMSQALEGIQWGLADHQEADEYAVAWRVGVPQPEGE